MFAQWDLAVCLPQGVSCPTFPRAVLLVANDSELSNLSWMVARSPMRRSSRRLPAGGGDGLLVPGFSPPNSWMLPSPPTFRFRRATPTLLLGARGWESGMSPAPISTPTELLLPPKVKMLEEKP